MKLYLASYRVADLSVLQRLVGKAPAEIKLAIVPNAKDYYVPRARAYKERQSSAYFASLGFKDISIVDLAAYTNKQKLAADLKQFDLLWVMGGNTFVLREIMHESGLDDIIREVLDAGVVYGGESAGAIVPGTNMHGVELADEIEFAERPMFEGMGLVEQVILPHCDNEQYAEIMRQIYMQLHDTEEVICLNDNQAYVIDGDERHVITGSVEVVE